MPAPDLDTIVSLAKRRGFIFPSAEIYGGFANTYDYGPLGVELKRNVREAWWRAMVRNRDDVVGLDAALITNPRVWVASGHVANFTDPLVDCRKCQQRFRMDHLEEGAYGALLIAVHRGGDTLLIGLEPRDTGRRLGGPSTCVAKSMISFVER